MCCRLSASASQHAAAALADRRLVAHSSTYTNLSRSRSKSTLPTGVRHGLVDHSDSNRPVHQSASKVTVGLVGLEPTTSCSQSRRATKLRHNPCRERYPVTAPTTSRIRQGRSIRCAHETRDTGQRAKPAGARIGSQSMGTSGARTVTPTARMDVHRDRRRSPRSKEHDRRLVPRYRTVARPDRRDRLSHR